MENKNISQKKNVVHKPGRTLLVKTTNPIQETFVGQVNSVNTTNGSQFIIFDTVENSTNALNVIKQKYDVSVKFAHYRIFFIMNGLDETSDYNTLKKQHIDWITTNSGANVLYYKQYLKNNKYIGCGDFTIDTKESMDKLLNKDDGLKQFTLDKYTGTYYKYNKK